VTIPRRSDIQAPSPVEGILDRLEKVRRSGQGWLSLCPAHPDRFRSLSIREGEDGRVLVNCFRGCTFSEIARALQLDEREFFPPQEPDQLRVLRSAAPVQLAPSVAEVLVSSGEFAESWELAKLLCIQEPAQIRQDVLASWDYISDRYNVPAILELVALVKGVALFRHARPERAHEPRERLRAVRKLLRELERVA
jgi:hypothetical protein